MAIVKSAFKALLSIASFAFAAITKIFKPPKREQPELDAGQVIQRRLEAMAPRRVLFGTRILGGQGFHDNSRFNNEIADSLTAFSAAPITAFQTLYLDGEPMTLSGDPTQGWVGVTSHFTGKPGGAAKHVPSGAPGTSGGAPIRVFFRLWTGDDNTTLGQQLTAAYFNDFNPTDCGHGMCIGWLMAVNTNDDFGGEDDPDEQQGKSFIPFRGFPKGRIKATGVKVCDPRNGGDYSDPATWTADPSAVHNAGLIDGMFQHGIFAGPGRERLVVGLGYADGLADIKDIDQIKANADLADLHGYTCHGVTTSGSARDGQRIRDTFNGLLVEGLAKVRTLPEGARPHYGTVDLSQYEAARITKYNAEGFSTEAKNTTRTTYVEEGENYIEKNLPALTKPEWVAEDGGILRTLETLLPFVDNAEQAARIEKADLFTTRLTATTTVEGLNMIPFEDYLAGGTITIMGSDVPRVNGRTWSIETASETAEGYISWQLREYSALAHDFGQTDVPNITINTPLSRNIDFGDADLIDPATRAAIARAEATASDAIINTIRLNRNVRAINTDVQTTDPDYDDDYDPSNGGQYQEP